MDILRKAFFLPFGIDAAEFIASSFIAFTILRESFPYFAETEFVYVHFPYLAFLPG